LTPALDGRWNVRRTGGFLPPMLGVGKTIGGSRGHTTLGPLRIPFRVSGLTLHYTGLLHGLEDRLEADAAGFSGRSFLYGVELGSFELRRA
jgi:hypothetical protein